MADINKHSDSPSERSFQEHPVDQLLDLASILAVVRSSQEDLSREQGTAEWGSFILIGQVINRLRALASRFGRDIDVLYPSKSVIGPDNSED